MEASALSNLFALQALPTGDTELFEALVETEGLRLERIVSWGQTTPEGTWYEQSQAEWVCLLQGEAQLVYESGQSIDLKAGDTLLIPAGEKHRVSYTSQEPPCIWLALHYDEKGTKEKPHA